MCFYLSGPILCMCFYSIVYHAVKLVQQGKELATKPDDLNEIPGTHMVEGEKWLQLSGHRGPSSLLWVSKSAGTYLKWCSVCLEPIIHILLYTSNKLWITHSTRHKVNAMEMITMLCCLGNTWKRSVRAHVRQRHTFPILIPLIFNSHASVCVCVCLYVCMYGCLRTTFWTGSLFSTMWVSVDQIQTIRLSSKYFYPLSQISIIFDTGIFFFNLLL